jgi:D-methionine transport system ATP-binding protein
VSSISRAYHVDLSILQANIEMIDGRSLGQLVVTAEGMAENIAAAIDYARENGVEVEELKHA